MCMPSKAERDTPWRENGEGAPHDDTYTQHILGAPNCCCPAPQQVCDHVPDVERAERAAWEEQ